MNPTHAALLSVVGHGGVAELHKEGINTSWIDNDDVRRAIEMSLLLHLRGGEVSFPAIMIRLKDISDWGPIAAAWQDGCGSTAREAVERLKEDAMRSAAIKLRDDISKGLKSKASPSDWLPGIAQRSAEIVKSAQPYNPSPSSHMGKPLPEINFPFVSHELNEIFRGGVWKGVFAGVSSLPGGGKSTLTTTMAGQCAVTRHKATIFTSEMPEPYVSAKIIQSWGIPWPAVVAMTKTKDSNWEAEYRKTFNEYLEYADQYLSVYGSKFMTLDKIAYIVELNHPDLVVIDHIGGMSSSNRRRDQNDSSFIGELAYGLEAVAVSNDCMLVITSQLNGADAEKFKKHHDLPLFKGFGSAQVGQAVRLGILSCRYWEAQDREWFMVKKDSLTGEVDTVHYLEFDRPCGCYKDVTPRNVTL